MAMTVRPDDEMKQALENLSKVEGISQQEVIRRAVLERYARSGHKARVTASGTALAERWSAVLDRLGSS